MSVYAKGANAEKGARYLGLLDQALCNANWPEVPELARKVDKHAPERTCLTLAARTQCQVAAASHRPASASSVASASIHGLGELVPRLNEAIVEASKSNNDDAYIGKTCLAEIHWLRETPLEALEALDNANTAEQDTKGANTTLGWLEVCEVKAAFIRASCLDAVGRQGEARESYQAALTGSPGSRSPELRRWTERLLAHACMYCVKKMPSPSLQDFSETSAAFRAWGEFWQRAPASTGNSVLSTRFDIPRRHVWSAYYELLSTLLQQDLVPSPQSTSEFSLCSVDELTIPQRRTARQQQRSEIKKVETSYETLLLAETKFPKASQNNTEIEKWCDQVMVNWRVFSNSSWSDSELDEGGKRTVSRRVLDSLYRAASKTFHSTPILRHLFTVHAALGEFDLALHAFDSYMEIVDKGKARAEKTGKHETGFDDDDTTILTAVEAVRVLCRYGDREQIEKAVIVSKTIEKWIEQRRPITGDSKQANGEVNGEQAEGSIQSTAMLLKTSTLGAAHRAVGISQARWAQLTYESEKRSSLLSEAKSHLQRAQKLDSHNVQTAHALALVLAELRDVSESIDLMRSTIEPNQDDSVVNGSRLSSSVSRQRRLLPMWHLLALCLTGEDQFEAAAHICDASFRQFGDPQVLFGPDDSSGITPEAKTVRPAAGGIVDHMESFEKESMIQIKITQIMLHELMEGPEEATDLTDDLSSLYSRLFGIPEQVVAEFVSKPPQAASHVPSRLGGTLRSITGSIRPRTARSVRSVDQNVSERASELSRENRDTAPQPATFGTPIEITITNEDGVASEKPHQRHHLSHLPFHGRNRRNSRSRSRSPAPNMARNNQETINEKPASVAADAAVAKNARPDQLLESVPHNAPHDQWPPPPGHPDQPPLQDVRLPTSHPASASTLPETRMPSLYEQRHKVSVLVKVWLFIASLYIRAEIYDDAENLINDATQLIESLELQLTKSEDGANARRLYYRGWGSSRSIDELWADMWSTKAQLEAARERPYEAMAAYELTLAHDLDHPQGIIGLSNLLMDIYEEKLPAEQPDTLTQPLPIALNSLIAEAKPSVTRPTTASTLPSRRTSVLVEPDPAVLQDEKSVSSPAELNRLAARDRAYMLVSNLTKQGAGWDDSEAWYTLARAHELSGEIGKAKQALWWVVELENNRPIRPWHAVSPGNYTL